MRTLVRTIAATLLFITCCMSAAKGNDMDTSSMADGTGSDYTANAAAIEQKKQEMLDITDDCGYCFYFTDDTDLQSHDPHAYWLMNRMMLMMRQIVTADDCWAWMLAMNECVEEYNSRLGRNIGSVDAACNAINELINIYNAGNQLEMNTASYVESIIEHYKTAYAYYRHIEFIHDYKSGRDWDVQMKRLYYLEFKGWFDINNAVNGIMYFYTYAAAGYTSLPMDVNGTFEDWSRERLTELEIERNIYWSFDWKPFESSAKSISTKKFNKSLNYFKTLTKNDVMETFFSDDIYDKKNQDDYEHVECRVSKYDFDKIAEMLRYYETALTNWREVREQIALMLSKEKQKSYREITTQMHARLYNDLADLKAIRY